ncbi:MAG: S41 family peptidase [Acidobacteria bacterium]|nr:S41 family peptidase [Acidobacteriota bacterium]MCA1639292.1 S41 family peptidase [Acidobacteriota bacterium]
MKKQLSLSIFMILGLLFVPLAAFAQQRGNEPPDMTVDAKTRTEVIEGVLKNLNDSYVFPEVAKKIETDVRGRLQNKEYDTITSAKAFADKLTADLQSVSRDKHMRVRYSFEPIPARQKRDEPTAEEKEGYRRHLNRINYGFEKIERLPGNIGYIDFRGFTDAEMGAETVAAAMSFVANTDALIFDVRQNGGGSPEMVALISSYLFGDKPVHLNSLYWREGNRTEDFFTKPIVSGKKYGGKDVYVLTSNRTFSAAEEFTNNLKSLKRATIVGETTGGGANPGGMFRLNEHFGIFVPTGRAINPITKTNWEGTGVKPDVEVPKELALKTAYLMALNKSLEKTKEESMKGALKKLIEQTQREIDEMKKK